MLPLLPLSIGAPTEKRTRGPNEPNLLTELNEELRGVIFAVVASGNPRALCDLLDRLSRLNSTTRDGDRIMLLAIATQLQAADPGMFRINPTQLPMLSNEQLRDRLLTYCQAHYMRIYDSNKHAAIVRMTNWATNVDMMITRVDDPVWSLTERTLMMTDTTFNELDEVADYTFKKESLGAVRPGDENFYQREPASEDEIFDTLHVHMRKKYLAVQGATSVAALQDIDVPELQSRLYQYFEGHIAELYSSVDGGMVRVLRRALRQMMSSTTPK